MPGAIIFMLIFAENLAPASFANQPLAPLVSIGIALCVFGGMLLGWLGGKVASLGVVAMQPNPLLQETGRTLRWWPRCATYCGRQLSSSLVSQRRHHA